MSVCTELVRAVVANLAPAIREYDAGHELDEAARVDRDAWLAEVFGL